MRSNSIWDPNSKAGNFRYKHSHISAGSSHYEIEMKHFKIQTKEQKLLLKLLLRQRAANKSNCLLKIPFFEKRLLVITRENFNTFSMSF